MEYHTWIRRRQWYSVALALACLAILAWGLGWIWVPRAADDRLAVEVLDGHFRSLMTDHLIRETHSGQ